jgi:hypothetical protein
LKRAAALLLLFVACRSTGPAGVESPITSLAAGATERSLMHIRATSGDRTQSFRAQLLASPKAMLLTAYTPIGTSAVRLYAAGDRVVFLNDLENTSWSGTPAEFSASFGFFGEASPVEMAQRILGRRGVESAHVGDVSISYDPPAFPPKHVAIVRGSQRMEIDHLESVYTSAAIEEPKVPSGYRCCVPPRL